VAVSTDVVEVGGGEPADAGFPPRRGRYLRLRVEDQGSGIAPDQAEGVFRPFVSSRESGRGMGLAAVAGVCLRHGGGVLLASRPGQGTVVDAFFPLAEAG
jgi:signal transduction histidine kinase